MRGPLICVSHTLRGEAGREVSRIRRERQLRAARVALTFRLAIAQRRMTQVAEFDRALAAAVYEGIAVRRSEARRRDDLGEVFHVGRLEVDDVCENRERARGF